ncbi:hypothetical protein ACFPVT_02295 [Corynebacterium choanae]|uniref:Uncharacterized protein n=1 Tax=Corynebacterium choanae TaxID=1862358 RepID=A0A3G6J5A7_9CORY|nr:hypothetical protein [Corynebacterium choanae]AZA12933.1 hypothetical protein CCHOA_02580 [Corynebacterium choanae]
MTVTDDADDHLPQRTVFPADQFTDPLATPTDSPQQADRIVDDHSRSPGDDHGAPQEGEFASTPRSPSIPATLRPTSRRDWIAAGVLSVLAATTIVVAAIYAPIRHTDVAPAAAPLTDVAQLSTVPRTFSEAWSTPIDGVTFPLVPQVDADAGVVVAADKHGFRALDPRDGSTVYAYHRDHDLCLLGISGFNSVVAGYRTAAGCSEITALRSDSGRYRATRFDNAAADPALIRSHAAIGSIDAERVELWRSDMVRTVEYGDPIAPQEPGMQPTADCTIDSALTRGDLLAVVESCSPDFSADEETTKPTGEARIGRDGRSWWLRLVARDPEDSREPEFYSSVPLAQPSHVVAIAEDRVAVAEVTNGNTETTPVTIYSQDGDQVATTAIPPLAHASITADAPGGVYSPDANDIAHAMTLYDGKHLNFFLPSTLELMFSVDDAIGNPIDIDGSVVYPTRDGLVMLRGYSNEAIRHIAIDRGDYQGDVHLGLVGRTLVERRGNELFGLIAEF